MKEVSTYKGFLDKIFGTDKLTPVHTPETGGASDPYREENGRKKKSLPATPTTPSVNAVVQEVETVEGKEVKTYDVQFSPDRILPVFSRSVTVITTNTGVNLVPTRDVITTVTDGVPSLPSNKVYIFGNTLIHSGNKALSISHNATNVEIKDLCKEVEQSKGGTYWGPKGLRKNLSQLTRSGRLFGVIVIDQKRIGTILPKIGTHIGTLLNQPDVDQVLAVPLDLPASFTSLKKVLKDRLTTTPKTVQEKPQGTPRGDLGWGYDENSM